MEPLASLIEKLSKRFNGFDLQHRRGGTDWPLPWRAAIRTNKNERHNYRLESFGATPQEACWILLVAIETIDAEDSLLMGTVNG